MDITFERTDIRGEFEIEGRTTPVLPKELERTRFSLVTQTNKLVDFEVMNQSECTEIIRPDDFNEQYALYYGQQILVESYSRSTFLATCVLGIMNPRYRDDNICRQNQYVEYEMD